MKHFSLPTASLLLLLISTFSITTNAQNNPANTANTNKTYTVMRILGDTSLHGVMMSKGANSTIKGLSEDLQTADQCIVTAGQYYPSKENSFGKDGNFMSEIYLFPQLAIEEMKPQCTSNIIIKKETVYYFLSLTGNGGYQMFYNNEVHDCLISENFPSYQQPMVNEWFKVSCAKSKDKLTNKKIWIKLDKELLKNDNICRIIAPIKNPSSDTKPLKIEGNCK